jgi:hypothetical protein
MNKILRFTKKSFYLLLIISLIFGIGVFGLNLFGNKNEIRLNVVNETEYEISKFTISYPFGVTLINNSLEPNQSKAITINPSIIKNNDSKREIQLKYFCDKKWRENKILIGLSKWSIIDKGWEIRIHNADSIKLLKR